MEFLIVGVILIFIVLYRSSKGNGIYNFVMNEANELYDKYAPYSFKSMREKIKELGKEALYIPDFDEVIKYIKENVKENDLVLTLGAGTITDISFKLVK